MPLSPLCLVQDGALPFVPTTGGVDVTPGNTISIKLLDTSSTVNWFLEILGTDELYTIPVLTNVNPSTHQVLTPTTIVTFTFPAFTGRAVGFKSTVTGVGGPLETTFGIYSLTSFTTRVGFVTETREGDVNFGWATKLNPLIRLGGGGGGGGLIPDVVKVDQDDSPVTVEQDKRYLINNNGAAQASNIDLILPDLSGADLTKRVYINTRYTHEPTSGISGAALITCSGTDLIYMGAIAGGHQAILLLDQSEENIVMVPYQEGLNFYWIIET